MYSYPLNHLEGTIRSPLPFLSAHSRGYFPVTQYAAIAAKWVTLSTPCDLLSHVRNMRPCFYESSGAAGTASSVINATKSLKSELSDTFDSLLLVIGRSVP